MKKLYVRDRAEWREWLSENHAAEAEIWLVYHKKGSGQPSLDYGTSVEEALCFGWVDSIIKKLDEETYTRKFTPRQEGSKWSPSNKKRVEKMIKEGLMTEHGMRKIEAAKRNGSWDAPDERPQLTFEMLPEFARALSENEKARETFEGLSATDRKQYLGWIEMAKRPETRQRRIAESIRLLEEGKKLGLR